MNAAIHYAIARQDSTGTVYATDNRELVTTRLSWARLFYNDMDADLWLEEAGLGDGWAVVQVG